MDTNLEHTLMTTHQQPKYDVLRRPDWTPIVQVVSKGQTFLLSGHRHPDGDSLGAITALYGILSALGKTAILFNDAVLPQQFSFLPYAHLIQNQIPPNLHFDATFLCDCGSPDRAPVGFPEAKQRGTLVVIDHHQISQEEGDICVNDPSVAAVGILIYELGKALGVPLSREIATSLYTSLMSDTGSFRYDKTTSSVMRIAAELLDAGAKPWDIASALYESSPLERQKLLALTLNTLEVRVSGKLASICITKDMLEQTGALVDMTDGFINFARGIKGVEVAVMFREQKDGWKLSFRSRGRVDVATIASLLGGGGHRNAAGVILQGTLDSIRSQVYESVERVLNAPCSPVQEWNSGHSSDDL